MHARHKGSGPAEPQPLRDLIPIAILRTCWQLRVECTPLLYGSNVFSFWILKDTEHLHPATTDLAPSWQRQMHSPDSWWIRRLWPEMQNNAQAVLDRFPSLEKLTFLLKPPQHGSVGRLSLSDLESDIREQRIAIAASWMKLRCPVENKRLIECLVLEVVPPSGLSEEEVAGSRFAAEDEEDENWNGYAEFTEAFELMKKMMR
jgi:hypothetical protein